MAFLIVPSARDTLTWMSGTIHHLIISTLVSQQPSSFQSRVVPQTRRVPLFYSLPSTSLLTGGVLSALPPTLIHSECDVSKGTLGAAIICISEDMQEFRSDSA